MNSLHSNLIAIQNVADDANGPDIDRIVVGLSLQHLGGDVIGRAARRAQIALAKVLR